MTHLYLQPLSGVPTHHWTDVPHRGIDRTLIPRAALHRHAVEPLVHWATTGPPATRGPLDSRADPTRHSFCITSARGVIRALAMPIRVICARWLPGCGGGRTM